MFSECSWPNLLARKKVPEIGNTQITEIKFGAQKDMYKYAKKELMERDRSSHAQQRNSIASARIEMTVARVKNMTHMVQPPNHEEVIHHAREALHDDLSAFRASQQAAKSTRSWYVLVEINESIGVIDIYQSPVDI